MFNSMKNALAAGLGIIGGQTTTALPTAEVEKPKVVVHTAAEAKASRHLVKLHGIGKIVLAPDVLDRHEDIVIADEIRMDANRQDNQTRRFIADPKNGILSPKQHNKKYHNGFWNGKYGNDLPMNAMERLGGTYNNKESRTPREIKADNAREAKAAA